MSFTPEYSEQEILRRIAAGDEAAFAILFKNYRDKIYSIAYELSESSVVAEEIVQDVFLKIWLRREGLGDVIHFRAYLFTSTRNYVFSALKSMAQKKNQEKKAIADVPLFYSDAENKLMEKEYKELLHQAISRLPAQQKQVYLLMKENGYNRNEAAAELNLSPETVKTHLAQAMRNIRAYCLSQGGTLSLLLFLLHC